MAAQDRWSGRTGFILATIGSAVGLGSIWKFPYEVGTNGGSAFVLCYLAGLVLVVFPLMLAEFAIGRSGRSDPATVLARIAEACGRSPLWRFAGTLGVLSGFLILSFYSVIGGWTLGYALEAGLRSTAHATAQAQFDALLADPARMLALHAAFMAIAGVIVARGIAGGIEAACKILMPVLIAMTLVLALTSLLTGDAGGALQFLFRLDLSHFSVRGALEALGLGFFSIGVGLGLMITYAAYADPGIDLREVALVTVVGDALVSFLAGLAIFPVVFGAGLDPAAGPGLMFITVPVAAGQLGYGAAYALVFYVLLFFAALASAISLLELVVAWLVRHAGFARVRSVIVAGTACWIFGIPTVLSFNRLVGWRPLAFVPGLKEANFYEAIDVLTSNFMLPVGGLLLAVFVGWIVPQGLIQEELQLTSLRLRILRSILRYVVPPLIVALTAAQFLA